MDQGKKAVLFFAVVMLISFCLSNLELRFTRLIDIEHVLQHHKWIAVKEDKNSNFQQVDDILEEGGGCEPVRSLVFAKLHKTGSSLLRTIIVRHLRRHKISSAQSTTAFPPPFHGGYPGSFNKSLACCRQSKFCNPGKTVKRSIPPLNLVSGHLRFNKNEIKSLITPGARFITSVRNPYRQFESSFNFYYGRYHRYPNTMRLKIACHLEPYLQVAEKFNMEYSDYIMRAKSSLNENQAWFFRSRNSQSYDLGLDPMNEKEDYVLEAARVLDSVFDLVFVLEHSLESLILLKETLCIDWEDLVVINKWHGGYVKHEHSEEEKSIIRQLNKQDFLLYDYFNATLWRKVDAYGRARMERHSAYLKKLIAEGQAKQDIRITEDRQPSNSVKKRAKRSILLKNRTFLPRIEQVTTLAKRLRTISGEISNNSLNEMANNMVDNYGWCTY